MARFEYTIPRKGFRAPVKVRLVVSTKNKKARVEWDLFNDENRKIGTGSLLRYSKAGCPSWVVIGSELDAGYTGKGIYPNFILPTLRKFLDGPIYSDTLRSAYAEIAWSRVPGAERMEDARDSRWRLNPPSQHWPVMSYSAAHRYEPLAKAKNVSAVARSGRGFMRAFQKAGSWSALPQQWKDRRNNFVSRHMAQVRKNGENLWRNGKPSRRALALIMWAYMPPRSNPLYRAGRHILFSSEVPEGRSNKVRYFLRGQELPWKPHRGFGPEWDEILDKSKKQARAIMAQRNPRTKVVRVKHGKRTLEVLLSKRSR